MKKPSSAVVDARVNSPSADILSAFEARVKQNLEEKSLVHFEGLLTSPLVLLSPLLARFNEQLLALPMVVLLATLRMTQSYSARSVAWFQKRRSRLSSRLYRASVPRRAYLLRRLRFIGRSGRTYRG